MLTELTEGQKKMMVEIKDEYIQKFNTYKKIDVKACTEYVHWLYTLSKLEVPEVVVVSSPLAAQYYVNGIKFEGDINNVKLTKKLDYQEFASYGNYSDYGWVAYYDFFTRIGVINNELFNRFKDLIDIGIYDMIQLNELCVVSELPTKIQKRGRNLHGQSSPAIEFADGFKLWYWNGIRVNQQLIEKPETITRADILAQNNAEIRRCYMEKLTAKTYYDILTDGKGLNMLDSTFDEQGNIMRLYETKESDDLTREKVQFLECICPSTRDVYNIYPPSQKAKTAWEAKYDTFGNKKIYARQGDVGMFQKGLNIDKPIIET